MNCKLEKFWNLYKTGVGNLWLRWTVNLKSFEIGRPATGYIRGEKWTVNLKSFEIIYKYFKITITYNEL